MEKYIITWHIHVIKLKGKKPLISLGICGKTKMPAFIALINPDAPATQETIKTLIIKSVYVNEDCKDAETCINLDCPYNHANVLNFAKYGVKTKQHLENLHSHLKEVTEKLKLETGEEDTAVYYNKPAVILSRQK